MYIECPKCYTKFIFPLEEINFIERKVRCSRCLHIWLFKNHLNEVTNKTCNSVTTEYFSPSYLPVVVKQKISIWQYLALFTLIGFIGLTLRLTLRDPFMKGIEFKAYQNLGFTVVNVTPNYAQNTLKISYQIRNNSNKDLLMPKIRIRVFDNKNSLVKSFILPKVLKSLAANTDLHFTTEITAEDIKNKKITKIDLTLGNYIDFYLM